jgi:hypothetical protein
MLRKHNFWKELPIELGFSSWANLTTHAVANLIVALVLGTIIGGLITTVIGKPSLVWGIILWTLLFALLRSAKKIYYFFKLLYWHIFNK